MGKGLESANSVKKIQCLCGARRARSRGVVCLPGAVVVVVGVDLLVGLVLKRNEGVVCCFLFCC